MAQAVSENFRKLPVWPKNRDFLSWRASANVVGPIVSTNLPGLFNKRNVTETNQSKLTDFVASEQR